MIQVMEWSKEKLYRILVGKTPPKPTEIPLPEVPRNILELDPEINMDFKENSLFPECVILETYQGLDKSYFQET